MDVAYFKLPWHSACDKHKYKLNRSASQARPAPNELNTGGQVKKQVQISKILSLSIICVNYNFRMLDLVGGSRARLEEEQGVPSPLTRQEALVAITTLSLEARAQVVDEGGEEEVEEEVSLPSSMPTHPASTRREVELEEEGGGMVVNVIHHPP